MPIRKGFEKFLRRIINFASRGVGADRIYRIIRNQLGLQDAPRSEVPRSVIREVTRDFRNQQRQEVEPLPTRPSARITRRMIQPIAERTRLGFKYRVDIRFKEYNEKENRTRNSQLTFGLQKLGTLKEFNEQALDFAGKYNREKAGSEAYPWIILMDTVKIHRVFEWSK